MYTAREQLTRVHRHYTAMYIRRAREVYTAVTRPCTGRPRPCRRPFCGRLRAVYTAVYMARTRPCNGGVHVCVCTRLCTRPRTGRVHGRVRSVSDRVDGCVRAVYRDASRVQGSCVVCYYDFLCKRHLLCRNVQLQIHYIQKELGQLALLAPRCAYNAHNRVN